MVKKIMLTDEQLKRCYELHEKRVPYITIGKELGVDRRVVAKAVKERKEENLKSQLANARRDVAADYFSEHIKNLELLSDYLLEFVVPPQMKNIPLIPDVDLEAALLTKFEKIAFTKRVKEHSFEEGEITETRLIDKRIAEKEAQETLQAHKEHFKPCWKIINQWEKNAEQYNSAFNELEKLCLTIPVSKGLIRSAIFAIVKKIESEDLNDERPERFSKIKGIHPAAITLMNYPSARRPLLQLLQTNDSLDDLFKQLETILSPYRQHKTILGTRCKFCPVP